MLEKDHYAIVTNESKKRDGKYLHVYTHTVSLGPYHVILLSLSLSLLSLARGDKIGGVCGVVTNIDLLQYITEQQPQ